MLWVVIALLIFLFQIATILILEFRHPAKSIAWLFIMFVFPAIGFVMYYFLAKEYKHRRKVRYKWSKVSEETRLHIFRHSKIVHRVSDLTNAEMHHQERLFSLLQNIPDSPITSCNKTTVLTNAPQTYEAILAAIDKAQNHIHLEYYTIRSDEIGEVFKNALIRKARDGVKVRLIYDGVGSMELSNQYLKDLKDAGVECRGFLPPFIAFFDKRINYRNHRKIVVVDGRIGFLGGINIGDEYLGKNRKLGYWRDTHLQLEGDSVYFLQFLFLNDWSLVSRQKLIGESYFPIMDCQGEEQAQIIASGPDGHWDSILDMFFASISVAKRRIYIATPYFIPDPSILMSLKTAGLSGIDVRIIIPGVPDHKLVHWASLSYVEELLQAGVRFYQYQKGFMHAKVMIVDDSLASIGTANMDMRSFFSNFELNALLFDPKTIDRVESDFMRDMADSKELTLYAFERRPRTQKALEVVARLLSPLL